MKVALTGGIGSGKSFICTHLAKRNIAVYDCDEAAKRLLRSSSSIQTALKALVGDNVYDTNDTLQKSVLAQFLLANEQNKQAVNNIVHPAVAQDFEQSGLDWLESAILFESKFYLRTHIDYVICVTSPIETRINRVMLRDNITHEAAAQWVSSQMSQEEMRGLSDFEITNNGTDDIDKQLDTIINNIKYTKH